MSSDLQGISVSSCPIENVWYINQIYRVGTNKHVDLLSPVSGQKIPCNGHHGLPIWKYFLFPLTNPDSFCPFPMDPKVHAHPGYMMSSLIFTWYYFYISNHDR